MPGGCDLRPGCGREYLSRLQNPICPGAKCRGSCPRLPRFPAGSTALRRLGGAAGRRPAPAFDPRGFWIDLVWVDPGRGMDGLEECFIGDVSGGVDAGGTIRAEKWLGAREIIKYKL